LREAELYYRYLETRHLRNVGLLKKKFKVVRLESDLDKKIDHTCPICCDDMKVAVALTCDERHIFHKDCI
jgi:hypothetical protein